MPELRIPDRMISYQLEVTTGSRIYSRWFSTPAHWSLSDVFASAFAELRTADEIKIVGISVRQTLWRNEPNIGKKRGLQTGSDDV